MKTDAAFLILASASVISCGEGKLGRFGVPELPDTIYRVAMTDSLVGDLASITDFAVDDSSLYVLDQFNQSVGVIGRSAVGWTVHRTFGRQGNGPGELSDPIAVDYDSAADLVWVLERTGEIEYYDRLGNYMRSERVQIPCVSPRIQSAVVSGVRLIAQRCAGTAFRELGRDTAYVLLASVAAGRHPRLLAAQAVATLNGDWGSFFDANWPIAASVDSVIFGAGVDNCFYKGSLAELDRLARRCGQFRRYSAREPAEFANLPKRNKASEFPDPLPLFTAVTFVGASPAFLRIVMVDSLTLESVDAPGNHSFVASLDHFVACKPGGCLWYDEDTNRLRFLSAHEIARLYRQ
jgi:hypothetical protein